MLQSRIRKNFLSTICFFLLLFTAFDAVSQTTASTEGIAIQGIARDNNNTAKVSKAITLKFTFYYVNDGTNTNVQSAITKQLTTDAFGVFSTVITPNESKYNVFAEQDVWLKIQEGNTIISDEILKKVPYAIAANEADHAIEADKAVEADNGVPTGAIMPYIAGGIPDGWLLCNGQSLGNSAANADLKALIGNNVPDLRGMFLRGTGGSGDHVGPNLMEVQNDTNQKHDHDKGTLETASNGSHNHNFNDIGASDGDGSGQISSGNNGANQSLSSATTKNAGNHKHDITGSTANSGGSESRPVNYGVKYIIKL